ncbi:MAG: matrixin family metalloprotease [Sandaracinaceae bacterium]|nr:matrixin family metalloprotease [Sandaracinaceae bacterium]
MSNARHILAFCLVAAATILPSASRAYYLEVRGTDTLVPIRYADTDDPPMGTVDVTYRINESTFPAGVEGVGDAIRAAFTTWNDAGCTTLVMTEGATTDSTSRAHWMSDMGEIYILVYFTDSAEEWTGGPSVGHFYFAHDGTGTLIGGTAVLNTRDHAWATDGAAEALDVQSVVTALIGRSLGITSAMEMNATFPRYAPGDISKQTLGDDDIAAIQFLYPSDDMACAMPADPEDECDGLDRSCPPTPMTMPGDGGTITPGTDGGMVMPGADGGTMMMDPDGGSMSATDAGTTGGGTDGCSCRVGAPASPRDGAWIVALVLASMILVRRRR